MARGIYSHEHDDTDFLWLINNYKSSNNSCFLVDIPGYPILLLPMPEKSAVEEPFLGYSTMEYSTETKP
jgi:hypothetical protein